MKKIYFLWSLAIATLCANVFFACKSDDTIEDFYRQQGLKLNPTQNPDFVIYSNGNVLATTLGTRAETVTRRASYPNGNMWESEGYIIPADITEAEREAVLAVFNEKGEESYTSLIDWDCFFVQQVWKGTASYTAGNGGSVVGSDHMDWLCTQTDQKEVVICWWPYEVEYQTVDLYDDHIFDFNNSNNGDYGGRMLMIHSNTNRFGYHNSEDSQVHYYFRMEEINGNYYVGLDFSGEGNNPNQQITRDYIYNDWIVKIVPGKGESNPNGGDNGGGDNGGGDNGGGDNGGGDNGGEDTPPVIITNDVEVNFSVNDEKEKDDYIATKLSIHIRALTDVEVFIPVEQIYYCDVDDMAIVLNHKLDPNYQYSNPDQSGIENGYTYTYVVAGEYVEGGVTVEVSETINISVKYEEKGIRVTTTGITLKALKYLQSKYFDGITVEVWNYYNSEIPTGDGTETTPVTRGDLKPKFDQSTITFSANPQYYVNAFAMLYEYQKDGKRVYMKDGKPYEYKVIETYDVEGKLSRSLEKYDPEKELESKYWVAKTDGTGKFYYFVGEKNVWDCTVTPPAEDGWTPITSTNPSNCNVIYSK